jgi:hypothetical protein
MTPNSDWWDRAKLPPRPQPIEIRKREPLCMLRKGEHAITLEKRPVRGVGDELIFSVNGYWRRMSVQRVWAATERCCVSDDHESQGARLANVIHPSCLSSGTRLG